MWLAGIPLRSEHVVELARFLALDGFADTAILLLRADADGEKSVSLDVGDKGAILRVLASCPEEFLELRATLAHEAAWWPAQAR
jgi:hypothetical protein